MTASRKGRRKGRPETRQEILDAARNLFAERGFAGASIRGVAAAAGVDPALVHHYFGTKEGLFRAALDLPIDPEALISSMTAGGQQEIPGRLVATFLGVWESAESGPVMVSFLRRAIADPESTAMLRDFAGATVLRIAAAKLLSDLDPSLARPRIALVVSHLLGLVILRHVLCVEPLASLSSAQLGAAVTPAVERYLFGQSAELSLNAPIAPSAGPSDESRKP